MTLFRTKIVKIKKFNVFECYDTSPIFCGKTLVDIVAAKKIDFVADELAIAEKKICQFRLSR